MQIHNPNCDGGHCTRPTGQTRLYRLGAAGTMSGNLILCRSCWNHENAYRRERQKAGGKAGDWPELDWGAASVYPEA